MNKRQFLRNIDASDITNKIVEDLYSGVVSIYVIDNANENTIEQFGVLQDQDKYGRQRITIGFKDEAGHGVDHDTDITWHSDRAYSKDCHPYVGLYCIRVDEGSSATWFADMQEVYDISSDELKSKAQDMVCWNTISKYMVPRTSFKSRLGGSHAATGAHKRVWRQKSRSQIKEHAHTKHPLVWKDNTGKYYFYSEAYTKTELEPQLQDAMRHTQYYKHSWKPNQLLVYNNYKTSHRRDFTPKNVARQHIRYALRKKELR